jgi:cullin-4
MCARDVRGVWVWQGRAADPVLFLALMDATWQDHCKQMLTIRSIFLYLDRTYVMQTAGVKSLWDLGLGLFRTHLERGHEVVRKAVTGLLRLLEKERQGESIDRMATKNLLRMFSSLQVTSARCSSNMQPTLPCLRARERRKPHWKRW